MPVGPRRTFEGAVEQIAEQIRLGELGAGDRLPSERDLAAAMQISRATLREAVRVLVDAGVLRGPHGVGGRDVRRLRLRADRAAALEVGPAPRRGRGRARGAPPDRAARRTARRRQRARRRLRATSQRTIDAQMALLSRGDVLEHEDRFLQLDTQFHLRIARASGNSTIVSLMRTLLRRLEIARDLALHEPPDGVVGDRRPPAHAGGDPLGRSRAHRARHGRAPRGDGARVGARDRPRARSPDPGLPAPVAESPSAHATSGTRRSRRRRAARSRRRRARGRARRGSGAGR